MADTDNLYNQATKGDPSTTSLYDEAMKSQATVGQKIGDFANNVNTFLGGPDLSKPYSGPLSDYMFSQTGAGRVLSAFGQGAKDQWGSSPSVLHSELDKEAKEKDSSILQGFHDALMRPAAAAIDFAYKAPFALGAGIAGATVQAGKEIGGPVGELVGLAGSGAIPEGVHGPVEAPVEAAKVEGIEPTATEGAKGFPEGQSADFVTNKYGQTEPNPNRFESQLDHTKDHGQDPVQMLSEARAAGVTGEGEQGYFGTVTPSPEALEGRSEAAKEAGLLQLPAPPRDVVPTIDELAREVDPDTFKQWDALNETREQLKGSLQEYEGFDSDVAAAKRLQIRNQILEADFKLRDLIPQTVEARKTVQSLLESDSKEGAAYRDWIQARAFEVAVRQEELKSDVEGAYSHASSLFPEPEPESEPPEPKASDDLSAGTAPINTSGKPEPTTTDDTRTVGGNSGPAAGTGRSSSSSEGSLGGDNGIGEGATSIEGTGEEKIRGLAKRMAGGSDIDLPTYKVLENEQQRTAAAAFIVNNPDEAMEIALGNKPAPAGINPAAILTGIKMQAERAGDIDTIYRLGTEGKRSEQATTYGQFLQLLKDPEGNVSATDLVAQLQKAREGATDMRDAQRIQNGIKSAIDKAKADFKPDWSSFLDSIKCD